jgi:hypothetical protein
MATQGDVIPLWDVENHMNLYVCKVKLMLCEKFVRCT